MTVFLHVVAMERYPLSHMNDQYKLFSRDTRLVFPENVSSQIVTVGIHNEDEPEINETFLVMLQDPSGGAVLSSIPALEVTILSNDVAHGVIRFDEVMSWLCSYVQ